MHHCIFYLRNFVIRSAPMLRGIMLDNYPETSLTNNSLILNQFRWLGTYAELYNNRPWTDPTKVVKSKLGSEFHKTPSTEDLPILY